MEPATLIITGGAVALLAATVYKFTGFVKYLTNIVGGETPEARGLAVNGAVTQLGVWFAGWAAVALVWKSQFAGDLQVTESLTLRQLDWVSVLLVGINIGSLASAVFRDLFKSFGNVDTTGEPTLIPPAAAVPPVN